MEEPAVPLSGRRAQAARNDEGILEAARAVFLADPAAPISAVAERAGVGISALYRRYRSKDDLLRRLASDGLQRYLDEAEVALADDRDPWLVFTDFMRRIVDADTHSLTLRLAGTSSPTEDMWRNGARAAEINVQLTDRAQAAGVLRSDLTGADLSMLFEQVAATRIGSEERTAELRHRYLALLFDALRAKQGSELPGPPPTSDEINVRWSR